MESLRASCSDSESVRAQVQQLQGTINQLQREMDKAGAEAAAAREAKMASELARADVGMPARVHTQTHTYTHTYTQGWVIRGLGRSRTR
eukprot:924660-Pelagomonas_calceolata.AAC.1